MKWGRQRRQQQQQEQEQEHPSSAFSLLRVFPLSWISKLKPTRSKPEPPPLTVTKQTTSNGPSLPRPRSKAVPVSKPRTTSPATHSPLLVHARAPPRLSPDRPFRPSSASDHLSFSPAVLDRLVGQAHAEPDEAPRRHSCAGEDDVHFFDVRNRSKVRRSCESARFEGVWTKGDPKLSSCRSCRADPEHYASRHEFAAMGPDVRGGRGRSSRILDVSPGTGGSDEDDDPGRRHWRKRPDGARRKPARALKTTGGGPFPPEHFVPPMKPVHRATSGDCDWRSSEKGRRQLSASEPRRSFSGKMRQRSRVKVYSPRTAAASRVEASRAKARKARTKAEEEEEERRRTKRRWGRSLESFAVVKCSVDPQRDFRESMVEMVREKGMGRPEELEALLACYLALNSDEYHDVIVKVFRQVWLEINPSGLLASESEPGEADDSCL